MDIEMTDGTLGSTVDAQGHAPVHPPQTINPSMLLNGQTRNVIASAGTDSSPMAERNGSSLRIGGIEVIDMTNSDPEGDASMTSEEDTEKKPEINSDDTEPSRARAKAMSTLSRRTGVCYDTRMRSHFNLAAYDDHPEDPRRVKEIFESLVRAGLIYDANSVGSHPEDLLHRILVRKASSSEICLVHTIPHYDFIHATKDATPEQLLQLSEDGDSVYYNRYTFMAAKLAAGGAIECCKAVVTGEVNNAIAVIRPPGHHATPGEAQGFCIFNNVSVAAKVCQKEFRDQCRKILIFDWDVHHGNGTQDAFYDDPNVLYMSIHVYANGDFYPCLESSDHNHCGKGRGVGKNVNVPWSEQGMGNAEYMYAFQNVIMPIAWEFDPDLVIVSAGFDAAEGDNIGGCYVTPNCYAQMTHALMGLANGKIAVCLEGGYNLRSISQCALAVTKTLMGEAPDRLELNPISKLAMDDVHKVMRRQSPYWDCMSKYREDRNWSFVKGERLHEIIRAHEESYLCDEYDMVTLPIFRKDMSEPLKNQVLATDEWRTKETLLVIVHDPPVLEGEPDPRTNRLEVHLARLINPVQDYIESAYEKGWSIMDVNIPKFLVGIDDKKKKDEHHNWRIELAENILVYLWDNYLQLSQARNLIFLGVGDAHQGIMHLLNSRDCFPNLKGVVHLINDVSLRAIKHEVTPDFMSWYHKNSLIYVNEKHDIWVEGRNLLKKRFGRVKQSPKNDAAAMLDYHQIEVMKWISAQLED